MVAAAAIIGWSEYMHAIINDYNTAVVNLTGHYLALSHRRRFTGFAPPGIYHFCHGGWLSRIQVALDGVAAYTCGDLGRCDRIQGLGLSADPMGKRFAATRRTRRLPRRFHRTLHLAADLPGWSDQRDTDRSGFDRDCRQHAGLRGVVVPLDAALTRFSCGTKRDRSAKNANNAM